MQLSINILLIGSGGREHALAASLSKSPLCRALMIAPGNPGTAECGTNVVLDTGNHDAVIAFCQVQAIGLVVVGPETPLVNGLVDRLERANIPAFGPSKAAARLEGSKAFTKELCLTAGIPTAAFARFTDAEAAKTYIAKQGAPIVVKADGLAAGKGVVVAQTLEEAYAAVDALLGEQPGTANAEIVIESCLVGEEASFFAVCDGKTALPFGTAQDHKRAFDGDKGPNTGGMGAYSPAPIITLELEAQIMREIITPTLDALSAQGTPYRGVLYAGLMLTAQGPQLIEYNVRFGDPEAQVLLPRLRSDLVEVMLAACNGTLQDLRPLRWSPETALTVVMASKGYPGPIQNGSRLNGVEAANALPSVQVFHAGTTLRDGALLSHGGRVLAVTAMGATVAQAQQRAYEAIETIDWPDGFYRTDIGHRALQTV